MSNEENKNSKKQKNRENKEPNEWEVWGDQDEWNNWKEKGEDKKVTPYYKRTVRARIEDRRKTKKQTREISKSFGDQATDTAKIQTYIQLIASAVLFAGGFLALGIAIFFIVQPLDKTLSSIPNFIDQENNALSLQQLIRLAIFYPPVFSALLGFILLGIAIRVSRYPTLQKVLSGISRVQLELTTGSGESKPLIQVVQETISNARQTFIVQLRLSQAMFWTGILLLAVSLITIFQSGVSGIDWETTGTMGISGFISLIFSWLIAANKRIQANLADVTQLELGMVGLAKQLAAIDNWLSIYLIEPYTLNNDISKEAKNRLEWALDKIQNGIFASANLVELYAQDVDDKKDEMAKERRELLKRVVETQLASGNTGTKKSHSSSHEGSKLQT